MTRPIVVVGAPSSIGIKPYPDGTQRRLDLAPGVLRREGVAAVADPKALGLEITIYDPQLDVDGASGTRLAQLLTRVVRNATTRLAS